MDGFDHLSVLSMGWLGLFIGVLDMWSVQFKSDDHFFIFLSIYGELTMKVRAFFLDALLEKYLCMCL